MLLSFGACGKHSIHTHTTSDERQFGREGHISNYNNMEVPCLQWHVYSYDVKKFKSVTKNIFLRESFYSVKEYFEWSA
jgi:hypothetical protein